jgi:hypothetical protein
MPDWLRPLYENNLPNMAPAAEVDMPDWLAYAYQQQDEMIASPDYAFSPMADNRLSIEAWLLMGEPSGELTQHLGSQRMLLDNVYLNLAREALTEAEKQIRVFYNHSGYMPDTIDMYKLRDVAEALKMYPVQVATLIIDTLLMASGEYETCPSETRHRGILGISQRILEYSHQSSMSAATEQMTWELLEVIEEGQVPQAGVAAEVRIHARKLLLGVIAGGPRY